MIQAVNDIKSDLRFRKESQPTAKEKSKQDAQKHSFSDTADSFQVAEEVRILSRMGMVWGESHIEVDESGFYFTLVFVNADGDKLSIVGRKNAGGENCGITWWLETEEKQSSTALVVGITSYENTRKDEQTPDTQLFEQIASFESEMATSVCDTIFHAAYLLWRVSLNKSDAAAVKAAHYPFIRHQTTYAIVCTQS